MHGDNVTLHHVRIRPWRRYYSFLGGGIAWTLHLLSIYAIGEFGCVGGWGQVMYWNVSAVSWMILSVSFLLLLLIVSAALVGYRDIQNDSKNNVSLEEDEGGAYLSKFGFILNILFIIIVIVETLPVFAYLHGC